jgi:hypothetical protein
MPLFLLPLLGFGKSAMSFFARPPGSWIACALAAALGVWWYGHHEYNQGHLAAQVEAQDAAKPMIAKQGEITHDVVTEYITVQAQSQTKTIIRIKEVPVHVTEKADAACVVGLGFVRVWNDAAHGSVPPASAGTDDTASGVALSEVAETAVQNSGDYDLLANQMRSLQEWVIEQHKANP